MEAGYIFRPCKVTTRRRNIERRQEQQESRVRDREKGGKKGTWRRSVKLFSSIVAATKQCRR